MPTREGAGRTPAGTPKRPRKPRKAAGAEVRAKGPKGSAASKGPKASTASTASKEKAARKKSAGRKGNGYPRARRHSVFVGTLTSLKTEMSCLFVINSIILFIATTLMMKSGLSGWISLPVTVIITLAITFEFSRGVTAQLREIRDAAEAVSQGDYRARVHAATASRDEIGQLARSFNVMADELEHADAMRLDLIANVSHELRTPVAALQAQVENMADGIVEPTSENLEGLLTQTNRLTSLISFLLDLSRMEAGAAALNISTFDLRDLLEDTVEPLEIADGDHGHVITMEVGDIEMDGDVDRLRQLFTNVISNALKHSADGSRVLVTARTAKARDARRKRKDAQTSGAAASRGDIDVVVVNVINSGSEIPRAARKDIFRRFVKNADGRPGTDSGGTGLGLPIAQWAAKLHRGNIRVVDDPRGVDFEITLPQHYESSVAQAPAPGSWTSAAADDGDPTTGLTAIQA